MSMNNRHDRHTWRRRPLLIQPRSASRGPGVPGPSMKERPSRRQRGESPAAARAQATQEFLHAHAFLPPTLEGEGEQDAGVADDAEATPGVDDRAGREAGGRNRLASEGLVVITGFLGVHRSLA